MLYIAENLKALRKKKTLRRKKPQKYLAFPHRA